GEATPITTREDQQPVSSETETWPLVGVTTAAAIPSPATTEITSASQHGSTAASTANINAREDFTLDLLARIAALEKELQQVKALGSVGTANCAPVAVGAHSVASGRPPFWSGPPLATSVEETSCNGVGSAPYHSVGGYSASCTLPPPCSGPPFTASTAQTAHGFTLPGVNMRNVASVSPLVGFPTTLTSNGIQGTYGPRKLPDLPIFGGQPEEWPIFSCAFTETTRAYNCTDLENNQRLLKALKDDAREAVKSLLIHPGNVSAVMEQLRFRFGRPEQLIRSQLNNIREVQPISEHNLAKIVPFATRVSNLMAFLQAANAEQHLGNPSLMEELVAKLPTSKRVDWAEYAATIQPFPTIVHFSAWLQGYANVLCTV
ncbi:hypothetical protein KR200_005793, partial [Drosophila serrata]